MPPMYLLQQLGGKNKNNNDKKTLKKKRFQELMRMRILLQKTLSKFTKSEFVILSDLLNADHECKFLKKKLNDTSDVHQQ